MSFNKINALMKQELKKNEKLTVAELAKMLKDR
jgi:hypothetical protein